MLATLDEMQQMIEATLAFARDDAAAEPARSRRPRRAARQPRRRPRRDGQGRDLRRGGPGRLSVPADGAAAGDHQSRRQRHRARRPRTGRPLRGAKDRSSPSTTTARASPPSSSRRCSSPSFASRPRGAARPAGSGSASPSRARSCLRMAASSPSPTGRAAASAPRSGCPGPRPPDPVRPLMSRSGSSVTCVELVVVAIHEADGELLACRRRCRPRRRTAAPSTAAGCALLRRSAPSRTSPRGRRSCRDRSAEGAGVEGAADKFPERVKSGKAALLGRRNARRCNARQRSARPCSPLAALM